MKHLSTLCIVSCLLIFNSCKNDKFLSSSPNSSNADTFLTATINGEKFVSSVRIVTFRANNQVYLVTADNPDKSEFGFSLIIENDKIGVNSILEKKDENGKNIMWAIPHNFDFTSTKSGNYLEGTFSFVAEEMVNSNNELKVTNGKFKALITGKDYEN